MLRNSGKGEQRTTDPSWLEEGHGRAEVRGDELGPQWSPLPAWREAMTPSVPGEFGLIFFWSVLQVFHL